MIERRLLIRCDGGNIPEIGTGHVRRCLALAEGLENIPGTSLLFLMRPTSWADRVRAAGHDVVCLHEATDEQQQLLQAAREHGSHIVFLDNLDQSAGAIGGLQAEGRIVISMDDPSPTPQADISVTPAFPSPASTHAELDRTVFLNPLLGRSTVGCSWDLFVSFGGFDPGQLALRFLRGWKADSAPARVLLAVGSDCADLPELRALAADSATIEVRTEVNFAEELPRARLAITNGGTTLFMAAANGVPSLSIAQYKHQVSNAQRLQDAGATRFVGTVADIDTGDLIRDAQEWLEDSARLDSMAHAGRMLFPGRGKLELAQTLALVERLDWDSDFFGLNIATLHPRRLTPNILRFALEAARRESVDCLYFLADGDHGPTARLAEDYGFRAVDDRLTFLRSTKNLPDRQGTADILIRPGRAQDGPELAEIAGTSYGASRYFHDQRFPLERCEQFYRDWIQKSLEGRFDDEVLVAVRGNQVAGYISCRANTANLGSIGLVGMHPGFRGRGIGTLLVGASLAWFAERDIPRVEVVTQGRNGAAQKLYESCGFVLHRVEKWYHNWLDEH